MPNPTVTRAGAVVAVLLLFGVAGLSVSGVQKMRLAAARSTSVNNLKQLCLAMQNYHDVCNRYPSNGISSGEKFPSPIRAAEGSCFYQIMPNLESDPTYRRPEMATPESPVIFKNFLHPFRGRRGHIHGQPVSDYAINLCALYGVGVAPTAENANDTLNQSKVTDGAANTVFVGEKAMHPADHDATDPAIDASFLNPAAGGTHRALARYTTGATTRLPDLTAPPPPDYTNPAAVRDPAATPGVASDLFGSPDPAGVQFGFLDGSVRLITYPALAAVREDAASPPIRWGSPESGGTAPTTSLLRALLTPAGGETWAAE
ncbi:MAG: DUF1559 domain-containing protein [Fimbriiglobus sp.]